MLDLVLSPDKMMVYSSSGSRPPSVDSEPPSPCSPTRLGDRRPSFPPITAAASIKTWIFFVRLVFALSMCFWIGYLLAILRTSQTQNSFHEGDVNFADFRGKRVTFLSTPDDVLFQRPTLADDGTDFHFVLIPLTSVQTMPYHKKRFETCMKSILEKSTIPLHFFFVVDEPSQTYLQATMTVLHQIYSSRVKFRYSFLAKNVVEYKLGPTVSMVQRYVSSNTNPYYSQSIFFLSVGIHRGILPDFVHRIIMIDSDLKFMSDIKGLFDQFDNFKDGNVMGIAYDQQPTYREGFAEFRARNPATRVGSPPPNGLTGFNSGVILLDITRMRASELYNHYLNSIVVQQLAQKYFFRGALGDQDFFSLIGNESEDLFYVLPCTWNRHLCKSLYNRYSDVFDSYFACPGQIHIYHGSCNSTIPV